LTIEIILFGFGDDKPACFQNGNQLQVTPDTANTTLDSLVRQLGFADTSGIVCILNQQVVAEPDWKIVSMTDGDSIRILSAMEGG